MLSGIQRLMKLLVQQIYRNIGTPSLLRLHFVGVINRVGYHRPSKKFPIADKVIWRITYHSTVINIVITAESKKPHAL